MFCMHTGIYGLQKNHSVFLVFHECHPQHDVLRFFSLDTESMAHAILELPQVNDTIGSLILPPSVPEAVPEGADVPRSVRIVFSATSMRHIVDKRARKFLAVVPGLHTETMFLPELVVLTGVVAHPTSPVVLDLLAGFEIVIDILCVHDALGLNLCTAGLRIHILTCI